MYFLIEPKLLHKHDRTPTVREGETLYQEDGIDFEPKQKMISINGEHVDSHRETFFLAFDLVDAEQSRFRPTLFLQRQTAKSTPLSTLFEHVKGDALDWVPIFDINANRELPLFEYNRVERLYTTGHFFEEETMASLFASCITDHELRKEFLLKTAN
jgi:hypothetical protein